VFASGPGLSSLGRQILSRYAGAGMTARLYLSMRWRWTPYEHIAAFLPTKGTILDLGSGHGLLSMALGLSQPARTIRAIDHEPGRVIIAQKAAAGLANLQFSTGGLLDAVGDDRLRVKVAGIAILDAIHYLDYDEQEVFLARARKALQPGGILLIRDVDAGAGKNFLVNRLYERAMTGLGFTSADRLNFRTHHEWRRLLTRAGFESASEPCSRFPFADLLFICKLPAAHAARAA
jgi:SAM-dependent methyltransferase